MLSSFAFSIFFFYFGLQKTKSLELKRLRWIVLDEADRYLSYCALWYRVIIDYDNFYNQLLCVRFISNLRKSCTPTKEQDDMPRFPVSCVLAMHTTYLTLRTCAELGTILIFSVGLCSQNLPKIMCIFQQQAFRSWFWEGCLFHSYCCQESAVCWS